MLEPYGVDYDYVMTNHDIEGKKWYNHYTWTNDEFDEFERWAVKEIMKDEKCTKPIAKSKFGSFNMQYGLRILDKH
jgi:hypothetical protein